jgi:hypothetical protein
MWYLLHTGEVGLEVADRKVSHCPAVMFIRMQLWQSWNWEVWIFEPTAFWSFKFCNHSSQKVWFIYVNEFWNVYWNLIFTNLIYLSQFNILELHNEELHNLYSSTNAMWMIKPRRMRLAGYVARMGRRGIQTGFWWGRQKESDHNEDRDVDGRIILQWI